MAKLTPQERRELLNGSAEPKIQPLNYTTDLIKAMNWYTVEKERKVRIGYTITYAKKEHLDISGVPDSVLAMCGSVCRLITRGEPVSPEDVAKIQHQLKTSRSLKLVVPEQPQTEPKTKPAKALPDALEDKANEYIQVFEEAIDANLNKTGAFTFNYDFAKGCTNPKIIKIILSHVESRFKEISEIKDTRDNQLKEAYSYIGRRELNHFIKFFETVIETLKKDTAVAKVTRKVRVKKEKPASVLVNKLKYAKDNAEFNIKSIDPKQIIGAKQVTLFNTKYRRLTIVTALEGATLSVRGTTIINTDPTKTLSKTLRKPLEQLPSFVNASLRSTTTAFKNVKSTEREGNSRVNEDTVILSVNK